MNSTGVQRLVVLALVASLLAVCVAGIAHAAMPADERMDCAGQLCDGHTGCAGAVVHPGLPAATMPPASGVVGRHTVIVAAISAGSLPAPPRPDLAPSSSRSPPRV